MKYLPSILAVGLLAFPLQAQKAVPPGETGDPFVKNPDKPGAKEAGKEEESPDNVLIVFETYSLNRSDAAALLETEANGAARYRRVLDMAKAGQAHLQTLTAVVTGSGQRTVNESNDEVRYATEFNPPAWAKGLATPTAWEVRNAGDCLEVEPVAGPDGHYCDLNLVPSRVTLAGFYDEAERPDHASSSLPSFNIQKITTSVATEEGVPYFLSSFTPPPAQGAVNNAGSDEMWLAFLHTSIQKPPAPEAKSTIKTAAPVAVTLEYSCYSLDRVDAREILVPPPAIGTAWDKVHALAGEKKAQLEFVTSLCTKSGQRAVVEETHEVRFMTEFYPPSVATREETAKTVDSNGQVISTTTTTHIPANAERIPGCGTAFDTRNAGINVEVEPVIRPDGLTINMNHVVQNVRYLGALKVTGLATQYPPMPLFQMSKVTTSETILSGKHTLVGTFNPPGTDGVNEHTDSGRTWLLFVKATVVAP